MSKLYVVGTPIGNLGDFSKRGIETLSTVNFIAAEDTRLTQKLLYHFQINTPLTSYFEHNAKQKGDEIVRRIHGGESCALVTDAGMPAISDPGQELVRLCHEEGISVVVVPGPTAVASAVALAGIVSTRFMFEGFLHGNTKGKTEQLKEVRQLNRTLVYYEAPHKLVSTLSLMYEVFGDRKISICRELTKLYEEVLPLTLFKAVEYYKTTVPRGEFVLVLEGATKTSENEVTFDHAVILTQKRQSQGLSLSNAAKEVAELTGYKKSDLYKSALETN